MEKNMKINKKNLYFGILLLISILIIFREFIFENKSFIYLDVGSDTFYQYYPYYVNCVRRIKEGTFDIWNWDYGLGTSFLNNLSQTFDPFGLFVIILGSIFGVNAVQNLLLIAQILKIILCTVLCRCFLKCFSFGETAVNMGSFLYAFNGYLMCWGQHYMLGTGSVYILILLICMEKVIREKRIRWKIFLTLSVTASMMYSYYNTYMMLVFLGLYALVRNFDPNTSLNWGGKIKKVLKIYVLLIIGILMSGIVLVPAANYLKLSSSRLDNNTSVIARFFSEFFSILSSDKWKETLSRMMSNNLLYINKVTTEGWGNYYEMPNLCVTIFIFFVLGNKIVRIVQSRTNKKEFIYNIIKSILFVMLLLNPGVMLAFNGFAYPNTRYTFVLIPIIVYLVSEFWDICIEKGQISLWGIAFGGAVSISCLVISRRSSSGEVGEIAFIYTICIVLFAFGCYYIWRKRKKVKGCAYILIFLFGITSIVDANITTNERSVLHKEETMAQKFSKGLPSNDTTKAIEYLKKNDNSFYRIEKWYADWNDVGDSLIEGYGNVTCYNSTMNRNVKQYYELLYENSKTPLDSIRKFTIGELADRQAISLVNVKYILSKNELTFDWCEYMNKVGEVYIYRNITTDSIARWYDTTISQSQFEQMEDKESVVETKLIVPDSQNIYQQNRTGNCLIGEFSLEQDRKMVGSIENDQEGMLMLSIPDQQGWNIYIDGKKVDIVNADYGFMAARVSPGKHKIEAVYHIPCLKVGAIVSAVGILLFFVILVCESKEKWMSKIEGKEKIK